MVYFVASLLSIFLNSITNVITNLKPFSSVIKPISLFLIADSEFLSCSSGLKEYQQYKNFRNLYKHEIVSLFLHFFSLKEFSHFVVLLQKELLEFLPAPPT